MPTCNSNPITNGFRGMLGGTVVFRVLNGKTVVSNRPRKAKKLTEHQENIKGCFLNAVHYAKRQMADAASREVYSKGVNEKLSNAYTVALVDFLKGPEITGVSTNDFHGRQGDEIIVHAIDNFKVASVWVELRSAAGDLLDAGNATQQTGTAWVFAATKDLAVSGEVQVVATAKDKPGHSAVKSVKVNVAAYVPKDPVSNMVRKVRRPTPAQAKNAAVHSSWSVSASGQLKTWTVSDDRMPVVSEPCDAVQEECDLRKEPEGGCDRERIVVRQHAPRNVNRVRVHRATPDAVSRERVAINHRFLLEERHSRRPAGPHEREGAGARELTARDEQEMKGRVADGCSMAIKEPSG
jgi:hypothetical protein